MNDRWSLTLIFIAHILPSTIILLLIINDNLFWSHQVFTFELVLGKGKLSQLPRQLKRRQDWVLIIDSFIALFFFLSVRIGSWKVAFIAYFSFALVQTGLFSFSMYSFLNIAKIAKASFHKSLSILSCPTVSITLNINHEWRFWRLWWTGDKTQVPGGYTAKCVKKLLGQVKI